MPKTGEDYFKNALHRLSDEKVDGTLQHNTDYVAEGGRKRDNLTESIQHHFLQAEDFTNETVTGDSLGGSGACAIVRVSGVRC